MSHPEHIAESRPNIELHLAWKSVFLLLGISLIVFSLLVLKWSVGVVDTVPTP